jgi:hypothetical protein
MMSEMSGQKYLEDVFLFDVYDQQCLGPDLKDVTEGGGDGAIGMYKAMELAGEYTEEDPKLEEKSEKQF